MGNRIMRIRFGAICALFCAMAIAARPATAWSGVMSGDKENVYVARDVYVPAVMPTPTATPCASVGSWTEQAPYPIAIWGHAVISVGGIVYSFGGIVNNAAITNAYKSLGPIPGRLSPLFPRRVVGSAVQATAPISICLVGWTKTSILQPRSGAMTRSPIPMIRIYPLTLSQPTSMPPRT